MMNPLSTEEGRILVETARQAITHHLDGKNLNPTDCANSELSIRRGVFVTLFDHKMSRGLRGCIGNPFPKTSLLNETVRCAVEAATMDPRFAPLRQDEFLNECCLKAGLMPDAWVTGSVKVARFQGQIFSEESPGGRVFERKLRGIGRKV